MIKIFLAKTSALAVIIISAALLSNRAVAQESDKRSVKQQKASAWQKIAPYFDVPEEFKGEYGAYRSPLKFYDGRPVKTRRDWSERRTEIRERWHELMGAWPKVMRDQELILLDSVSKEGYTQYRVSFFWTPNEQTHGYLLVPHDRPAEKTPAVITVFYEPETAIGMSDKPNRDFALQLTKRGFITLSLG
ncbi:MAG TPA: sialidase, partial [Chryseosolibacter sp.]|nr:sialidase [Chryseosolibacter sp.]